MFTIYSCSCKQLEKHPNGDDIFFHYFKEKRSFQTENKIAESILDA